MGIFDKLFGKRKKQELGMSLLEIGSGKSMGTIMWISKPTKIKSEEQAQPIISQILKETLEEEVGLVCEIVRLIGHNIYRFRNKDKQLIEKKVDYYLMKLKQDKNQVQVEEIDIVEWLPFMDAIKKLTFKPDKDLVQQAVSKINTN